MKLHELGQRFAELTANTQTNATPNTAGQNLERQAQQNAKTMENHRPLTSEDPFLSINDLVSVKADAAARALKRALNELEELIRENKWEEIKTAFYPIEEKQPELVAQGLDAPVRAKIAFALGHMKCFDEAVRELTICIAKHPDHFLYHSSLAYTAYDSLYAAKNRDIFLSGKHRADRIALAHTHFQKAQELRPDGVTNFYRQGMLFKQIENKPENAIPLFQKAISNWEALTDPQKKERHQEQKNYVKSLYELASCLLESGKPGQALDMLKKCLAQDESTNYLSLMFKYFALGKVHYELNRFVEARDALLFALQSKPQHQPSDFVYELLARTYLALNNTSKAWEVINRVPEAKRKPYYRWTEAEILCALSKIDKARDVLAACQERDNLSRHKTLIRLAKIEYLTKRFEKTLSCAEAADRFFQEKWGGHYDDALFWQALASYKLGNHEKAKDMAMTLKAYRPYYPKLNELMERLKD